MDYINKNKDKIIKFLFVAGTVAFIYFTVNFFFGYIAPFVFGFLFSLMLEPLVGLIVRRTKAGRGIAAAVCVILLSVIVSVAYTGIITQLISQGRSFVSFAISFVNSVPSLLDGLRSDYADFISFMPDEINIALSDLLSGALSGVASALGSLLRNNTGSIASTVASFLLGTILMLVSAFFFVKDKLLIADFFRQNTPGWLKEAFYSVRSGVAGAILGYMKSQLFLMIPTAVICVSGLFILKYPYALFVGLLIAVFDMLPVFGAGLALGPWAFFSFITGNVGAGVGLIVIYVLIVITRQILEPRIIGRQIGLHPLITLMSIYIGLKVFGVFGFLIGPLTVVIIKALVYGELTKNKSEKEKSPERAEGANECQT